MELSGLQPSEILITSHLGADFDSFGSLIAASCCFKTNTELHEQSNSSINPSRPILIWPQSNEDAMNMFIKEREDTLRKTYNFFRSLKEVSDWQSRIKGLIVVDTRKLSRLKHIQELLDHFGIGIDRLPSKHICQVVVVDHHPLTETDIQAHQVIHHLWGSATSILVDIIPRMKGFLDVTSQEATWLLLGIYNDTGAFTYASTTHFDLSAAASLRAIPEMDMGFVQSYMHQMFERNQTLQHPALMADEESLKVNLQMQHSAKSHTIYDHNVAICHVILPEYIRNFASAVEAFSEQHHEITNLVVLARFGAQVVIIGRSKKLSLMDGGIDMGILCKAFGGGGHFAAASATVKNLSFHQVIEELFAHLYSQCGPKYSVSQLMTKSPIVLTSNHTIENVIQVFQEHSIKTIPITNQSQFIGVVDRAMAFQWASGGNNWKAEPVQTILIKDITTLPEEAPLEQAVELIHRRHQRIVPVLDQSGCVVGVISRADIVNHFLNARSQFSERPINQNGHTKNIKETLQKRLSATQLALLASIGSIGDEHQAKVYLIGKALRAALTEMSIPSKLDILVEFDQQCPTPSSQIFEHITAMLTGKYGGNCTSQSDSAVVVHCKLKSNDFVDVKIISAKLEQYPHLMPVPVAHVTPLTMQLYRKCFTVDAIAVALNQAHDQFGNFYDTFSVAEDVASKTIEVLDSLAFIEAPTRIFNAIILEGNGFTMGKNSERLIKTAVTQFRVIDNMDGAALLKALKMVLENSHCNLLLDRLHYFQVLKTIHTSFHTKYIHMQDSLKNLLHAIQVIATLFPPMASSLNSWALRFLGMTYPLSQEELEALMTRLSVDPETQSFIQQTRTQVLHLTSKLKQTEKELKGTIDGRSMAEALASEITRQHMKKEGLVMAMSLRQDAIKYYVSAMTLYNMGV